MKRIITLSLVGSIISCLSLIVVMQTNTAPKVNVATYLAKRHISRNDIHGVLSNMTNNHDNIYDWTF